jgi:CHAT domain-containing protein
MVSVMMVGGTAIAPSHGQSGNQSDVTAPNPVNVMPAIDTEEPQIQEFTDTNTLSEQVDRVAYEAQIQQISITEAVQLLEEYQAFEFCNLLELDRCGDVPSLDDILTTLYTTWQETGNKTALIYVVQLPKALQLIAIVPPDRPVSTFSDSQQSINLVHQITVPIDTRDEVVELTRTLRRNVINRRLASDQYTSPATALYDLLITPLKPMLEAQGIEHLLFSLDQDLRLLPLAVLYDGEEFLIEQYGVGIIPSFGLVDTGYQDIRSQSLLAMGASQFTQNSDLPAVDLELDFITRLGWQHQLFKDEQFTVANFMAANQANQFGLIHLATHAEFNPANPQPAYLQFADRTVSFAELRELVRSLGWIDATYPTVELLILSACETAVGDRASELGFAGLAVQLGVKSALASLWRVSDLGTLALMSEYYLQLRQIPIKSQALRQAQINLLRGQVSLTADTLILSNGQRLPLPPRLQLEARQDLQHPMIWSGFQLVGYWN